jgi:signal transduction histidine kinase/ActR/RegA family two-component response regulator
MLLYPLTSKARLIGVAGFYGRVLEPRVFDDDLRNLLSSFAISMANLVARKGAEDERSSLERQLRQAQKMEAIGTLAGGIAHDFNNILGAIVGNLGLARIDNEHGRPVGESLLEIERASERARALVQQILAFSRQQEHEREVVALAPIVSEATRLMRATIPATVAIETDAQGDAPDVVADQTQVHQILMNLCANAWHAMEDRPGTIAVGLKGATVRADQAARMGIEPGRYACLSVRDNGRGMDEETLNRVFDPFFTTKNVGKGTGLGMSVVHGIVRSHLGGISIDSKVGRGTQVRIYLPAATGTAVAAAPQPSTTLGKGEHILLVDDEDAIVRVMTRILERLGYRVSPFTNAVDALAAFRADGGAFDLVISDFEMPDATGLELARVIHGERPATPVILCSGRYRADTVVDPDAGANVRRLINKPCSASVLSRVVRDVLDERASA